MLEKICPLTKEIKPSIEGGIPCELCSLLIDMGDLVNQAAQTVKEHPLNQQFTEMKRNFSKLKKLHKRCPSCGLCFGGAHIAFPKHVKGVGNVCQYCSNDIERDGIKKFLERLKKQDELELEED